MSGGLVKDPEGATRAHNWLAFGQLSTKQLDSIDIDEHDNDGEREREG